MAAETSRIRLTGYLPGLDGLRGLAILLVMSLHFVGDATPQTLPQRFAVKVAGYGLLGVDLFFVLSGFLITGLLLEARGAPHYFRNFYARRTLRIFPLYYAVLALLFVVVPRFTSLPAEFEEARQHQAWLWTYSANFYIAARSSWALSYVSHFWSLAIEEHFYLLWPLVVFSFRRELLERICFGILVGGLALRVLLALNGMSELSISVLTPCRIDTLIVGGLLALVARREGGAETLVRRSGTMALSLAATIVLVSAWCATIKLGLPVLHQVRNTLYALFFGALVLISLQPRPGLVASFFQWRVPRFLGKYAYGLYVYHGILLFLFKPGENRFDALVGSHALAIWLNAAAAIGLSLLAAVLSYELFEKRFLSLKRFFETRDSAASAAPALN